MSDSFMPEPISVKMRECAVDLFVDHRDQLYAVASSLEESLARMCKQGEAEPCGPPLNQWRLAQVLTSLLESTATEVALRSFLALDTVATDEAK